MFLLRQLMRAVRVSVDALVDAKDWASMQYMRRKMSLNAVSHRMTGENQRSVWHILGQNEDTEWVAGRPGKHRDNRGWRYTPKVWHLVTRLQDERASFQHAAYDVWHLLNEMRMMISFPPEPETFHGCRNCLCSPELTG